jgi:hypothetical protein
MFGLAFVNRQHKTRYKAPNFNFVSVCTTVISAEVHIKKSYNNVTNYSEQDPTSARLDRESIQFIR